MESKFVNLNLEKILAEFPIGIVDRINISVQGHKTNSNNVCLQYDIILKEAINVNKYQNVKIVRDNISLSLPDDRDMYDGLVRAELLIRKIKKAYNLQSFRIYNC